MKLHGGVGLRALSQMWPGLSRRAVYCLPVELALHRAIALAAFLWTYLGLALGRIPGLRVDRTGVAIIGAAAMVVTGVIPWERAVAAVDAHTLALLFGMMIVSAYLRLSGFFHLVTVAAVRRTRTPFGLLAAMVGAAGVLSALFVNDVVCLVLAPLVLDVTRQLRLPPVPYLIALATAANVGSVATLTGNPQNMLVGSFSGLPYRTFLLYEAPVALVGLGCVLGVVWLVYRRELHDGLRPRAARHQLPDALPAHGENRGRRRVDAGRVPGRRAGLPRGGRRRGLYAPDQAGQAGQGLPGDQLGAARALHGPVRPDRRGRGYGPDRSSWSSGSSRSSSTGPGC